MAYNLGSEIEANKIVLLETKFKGSPEKARKERIIIFSDATSSSAKMATGTARRIATDHQGARS